MLFGPKIWNKLWLLSQKSAFQEFLSHKDQVEGFQKVKLASLISNNKNTQFGKDHSFEIIHNYQDYIKNVPIIEDFQSIQKYIDAISFGENNVLTADKVLFFESTSGTTTHQKLIPYTNALKKEFQIAVSVWMHSLQQEFPKVFEGKAYWSISPQLKERGITDAGISIGITSDTDYFNPFVAYLLKQIMAVNHDDFHHSDAHEFYLNTSRQLLACEDLSFISVWSPNFFLQLHDFMLTNLEEILDTNKISSSRKKYVKNAQKDHFWSIVFPRLAVISCWTDAQAEIWMPSLKRIIGSISLQAKGLLSTEAVVSIPMYRQGNVLSYTAHFYEFRCVETEKIYLAHELMMHDMYEVIVTTGGGLYRYNTHDVVLCEGYFGQIPKLKFCGRKGDVSDLVGEKLDVTSLYPFFGDLIDKNQKIHGIFISSQRTEKQASYEVLVECEPDLELFAFKNIIEIFLMKNPYYQQAKLLRQLGELKVTKKARGFSKSVFEQYKTTKNMKDGDVKLPILLTESWMQTFRKSHPQYD